MRPKNIAAAKRCEDATTIRLPNLKDIHCENLHFLKEPLSFSVSGLHEVSVFLLFS